MRIFDTLESHAVEFVKRYALSFLFIFAFLPSFGVCLYAFIPEFVDFVDKSSSKKVNTGPGDDLFTESERRTFFPEAFKGGKSDKKSAHPLIWLIGTAAIIIGFILTCFLLTFLFAAIYTCVAVLIADAYKLNRLLVGKIVGKPYVVSSWGFSFVHEWDFE